MKLNKTFSAGGVLLIGLVLSVVVPISINLLNIVADPHKDLILFVGVGMTSLTTVLSLVIHNQNNVYEKLKENQELLHKVTEKELQKRSVEEKTLIKEAVDDLNDAITNINKSKVVHIDRNSLYKKLKFKIEKANRISLTYWAKRPPNSYTPYDSKNVYLGQLDELIKKNVKPIKRIVLYTEDNKEWIKSIADRGKGKDKFSISILEDNDLIPRVPFQMIDNNSLIIIGKVPSESVAKRDVIIESREIIETYEVYYSSIWKSSKCHQIVENGVLHEDNYKRFLE